MRTLIVWHNLNENSYYYRFVSSVNSSYYVGFINGYNHQIILMINSKEIQPIVIKKYISIRKAIAQPLIRFLEWFSK